MILAVVIDGEGRPVCTERLAGNTSDSTALLPVMDCLCGYSTIGRGVFVVTDRGIISAATIAALKKRGLECILGTRDHCDVRVSEIVLESDYHSRRF